MYGVRLLSTIVMALSIVRPQRRFIYVESSGSRDPDGFVRNHYTSIFSPAMTPVKKYDDPGEPFGVWSPCAAPAPHGGGPALAPRAGGPIVARSR